jgi:hypothetical protein
MQSRGKGYSPTLHIIVVSQAEAQEPAWAVALREVASVGQGVAAVCR